MINALFDEC
ncbi:hypothetical protein YPPY94_4237, partial [Yersinia pestis PY-94]